MLDGEEQKHQPSAQREAIMGLSVGDSHDSLRKKELRAHQLRQIHDLGRREIYEQEERERLNSLHLPLKNCIKRSSGEEVGDREDLSELFQEHDEGYVRRNVLIEVEKVYKPKYDFETMFAGVKSWDPVKTSA